MPLLRCIDPDCGHEWFEPSRLGEGADCIECGGPTAIVGKDDDDDVRGDDLNGRGGKTSETRPRIAFARENARALLRRHGITGTPVPVRRIAEGEGLEIRETDQLPSGIRARLVGDTVELARGDIEVVKRFSVAHELGHHRLETLHDQGPGVETEANVFAGELLVPRGMLVEALRTTTDTWELARMFEVSQQVVRIAAQQHKRGGDVS